MFDVSLVIFMYVPVLKIRSMVFLRYVLLLSIQ